MAMAITVVGFGGFTLLRGGRDTDLVQASAKASRLLSFRVVSLDSKGKGLSFGDLTLIFCAGFVPGPSQKHTHLDA